jgi:hypothetical protein
VVDVPSLGGRGTLAIPLPRWEGLGKGKPKGFVENEVPDEVIESGKRTNGRTDLQRFPGE